MPSLGLQGPFALNEESIDKTVDQTSPGNYALGDRNQSGTFLVDYVGRSDNNLNGRLKQHVGENLLFKADYASSPKTAFEKECNNYHDFTPPRNKNHPARPANSGWSCPRCTIFD